MRERRTSNSQDTSWFLSVEEVYYQLIKHLSDKFIDPMEATNKATNILVKYYLKVEE